MSKKHITLIEKFNRKVPDRSDVVNAFNVFNDLNTYIAKKVIDNHFTEALLDEVLEFAAEFCEEYYDEYEDMIYDLYNDNLPCILAIYNDAMDYIEIEENKEFEAKMTEAQTKLAKKYTREILGLDGPLYMLFSSNTIDADMEMTLPLEKKDYADARVWIYGRIARMFSEGGSIGITVGDEGDVYIANIHFQYGEVHALKPCDIRKQYYKGCNLVYDEKKEAESIKYISFTDLVNKDYDNTLHAFTTAAAINCLKDNEHTILNKDFSYTDLFKAVFDGETLESLNEALTCIDLAVSSREISEVEDEIYTITDCYNYVYNTVDKKLLETALNCWSEPPLIHHIGSIFENISKDVDKYQRYLDTLDQSDLIKAENMANAILSVKGAKTVSIYKSKEELTKGCCKTIEFPGIMPIEHENDYYTVLTGNIAEAFKSDLSFFVLETETPQTETDPVKVRIYGIRAFKDKWSPLTKSEIEHCLDIKKVNGGYEVVCEDFLAYCNKLGMRF